MVGHDRLERIEQQTGKLPNIQDQIDRAREDIVRLDKELAVISAQIDLLKSMNGIVIAGVLALIVEHSSLELGAEFPYPAHARQSFNDGEVPDYSGGGSSRSRTWRHATS